jgi:hypothetical protein
MANKKARVNDKDGGTVGSLQTVRVPLFENMNSRAPNIGGGDRLLTNCFPEKSETKETGFKKYYVIKRPGTVLLSQPTGAAATGRGIYSWNGDMYSVFNSSIYKNTTLLISNMGTSTGLVNYNETGPDAPVQYLAINDGSWLYLIDTGGGVTILNNVVISTSSVAFPTVITTATPHGLATGNKVVIRNHAGSTPSINGISYTVTVTGASTFTIPVNVTVAGTGGTIGIFPSGIKHIETLSGYLFVGTTAGRIYNCDFNDPTNWQPTSYITAQMTNDKLVGLARQNNYLVALKEKTTQFFYISGTSITGATPLANAEQAINQIGCAAVDSIQSLEDELYWIGSGASGGFSVYKVSGTTQIENIGEPSINRMLDVESANIVSATCTYFTVSGHPFYAIYLKANNLTYVWVNDSKCWVRWTATGGGGTPWNIISTSSWVVSGNGSALYGQDRTSGQIFNITPYHYVDNGVIFPVSIATGKVDLDTSKRKFWEKAELVADTRTVDSAGVSASCPISIYYSDDDGTTFSTPRTYDLNNNRVWSRSWGNSRRRNWVVDINSATNFRADSLEFDVRIGEY